MDTVLTTMFYFWVSLFIVFFLTQRGLWIFSDVAKGTVSFMLEKALGPGSDLVEGRSGSGARSWILQGTLWLILGSMFTFTSMWLTHDPNALHSLASWGFVANANELASAGVSPGYVRLSIGLEHIDDIIDDLKQAFDKVN